MLVIFNTGRHSPCPFEPHLHAGHWAPRTSAADVPQRQCGPGLPTTPCCTPSSGAEGDVGGQGGHDRRPRGSLSISPPLPPTTTPHSLGTVQRWPHPDIGRRPTLWKRDPLEVRMRLCRYGSPSRGGMGYAARHGGRNGGSIIG